MALVSRAEVSLPPSALPALSSAFRTTSSLGTPGTKVAGCNLWFMSWSKASMSWVLSGSGPVNANDGQQDGSQEGGEPAQGGPAFHNPAFQVD